MRRFGYLAGAAAAGAMLAGCMGPTALKPLMDDSEAYSARYFQPDQVPANARTVIAPKGSEPLGFKRLTVKGRIEGKIEDNGKWVVLPRSATVERVLINDRDDGTVREIEKRTLNGLPMMAILSLSYHGLPQLLSQRGFADRRTAGFLLSLRSASTWQSLADVKENATYDYAMSYGVGDPLVPSVKAERHCKSGASRDARAFLAGTPGQVIELVCDDINNSGVKSSEIRFAWLTEYKVAIVTRIATLGGTTEFKYDNLTVQQ